MSSTFISFPISLCEFDRTDCCRMKERELGTDMPGKYQSTARLGGTISTAWVADYFLESHTFVHKILSILECSIYFKRRPRCEKR